MNRIILLGASNVTLGFPRLVESLTGFLSQPLEIWAAHGHGRSYGDDGKMLGRALPGITQCLLWDELSKQVRIDDSEPPRALVTDIGNDILFEHHPEQILGWIECCLQRLDALQARVVMTRLPVASVDRLTPLRFRVARKLLFPRCTLTLSQVNSRVDRVDEGIAALGERYGATMVEPAGCWYGLDPIHIRTRWRNRAWSHILASWYPDTTADSNFPHVPFWLAIRDWRWRPAEWSRFRRERVTSQPVHSADGISVHMY